MSFNVVTVKFSNEKTCFVSLSAGIFRADSKQAIQVFEIEDSGGGRKAFVSWSGETTRAGNGNDGSLQINGLYGDKLGLKDKDTVVLRPVPVVSTCIRVSVEPLSVDDWEILDRHTSFIESNLMDQVRVIQRDRVYPIWVTKSTVIYIKIGATTPDTDCVLLVNETEVLVSPKVRSAMIGQPVIEEPMQKSVTNHLNAPFLPNSSSLDEVDTFDTKFSSTDSDYSLKDFRDNDRKIREKSPYDMSNISNHWRGLFEYLGFRRRMENTINVSDDENDDNDEDDSMDQSDNTLPSGLNLILRVQHLKHTIKESDQTPTEPVRRGSHSPRKNGNRSPRKRSSESPSKTHKSPSNPSSSFSFNQFPQQPSTIYMDKSEVEKQLKCNRNNIPSVFLAKLRRLPTPREQQQEKLSQSYHSGSSGKSSPRKGSKNDRNVKDKPSPDLSDSMKSDGSFTMEGDSSCVVRVVTLDRRRQLCNDRYRDIVLRIQEEQPLLNGHVIIPDMLRRFLKLETTSRVWIQTYKGAPTRTHAFSLYPLGNVPNHVTNDMMTLAVRQWLDQVSNEDYPLVVFQGLFVRFPVLPDKYVESQITYNEQDSYSKCCHTLLHPGVLRNASMSVVSGGRSTERTHPAVQPMLAYNSILNYSPVVPDTQLNMIGGMSDIIEAALSNIEICLGSRSLYKEVFMTTPGLLNGMLLLTGPKGSGKTTLARALCREVSELPNLAHTMIVECKPLRGKKSDSIQKIFEMLFDEAAWHQPSLVVLEDLDHLAGSPAGPEFEMTGEALYAARIAEIVKDLLRKDIRNMSNIAVLATSQSRSSLHSILVSSRGTHLVQDVMCIKPPDQKQRQEILRTLLEVMTTVSQSSLNSLDWEQLAQSTQGYVARDLENIVNRAVHAHILRQGRAIQNDGELDLNQDDFLIAMEGFTPASIRNVPLHQAGELGWDDIGGLTDVKETLVETLQWPTKYPALFANCPLRIRSGLLLYGAPGTGKTLLAGVVAKECGLNFISIKGPELLSKYIGASEQAVRDTFVRAQSAKPCILFFDEFDSIAPRRGHDNTGVTDRVVNQLLTQLDGVEGLDGVYVLAATSRPDLIDPALLRPGRLDKSLLCKLPNEEERLKILKALSRKMSLERDIEFEHFAKTCQDFTGADFKAMLYNAQLEAIHEFTSQDAAAESDMGRFGMKSRKNNFAAKMKNRANTKLKINVKNERRKSFSSGTFAFIPNLEEGVVQVSAEMEERLNTQVSQIRLRDRRNSEHFTGYDEPDSPFFNNKLIVVSQAHMLSAFSKMRPSVSGQERLKYQRIYENFVSSRGGNFDTGILEALSMKATLA